MRTLLIVVLLSSLPTAALADALGPPPTDCAQGSIGQSSRAGSFCVPTTCTSTAECPAYPYCATTREPCPSPEPYRCSDAPVALCTVTSTVPTYHRYPDGTVEESSETVTSTSGPCQSDADCTVEGARCERARRCVHGAGALSTSRAAGAIRSGCGCRVVGARSRLDLLGVLGALFALGSLRRRAARLR